MQLFQNPLHNEFGSWPLAYIPFGGLDLGEIAAVGAAVGNGDDAAYYGAWMAAGDRLFAEAEAALAAGHRSSARDGFLRASVCYVTSYHPLYGALVDPRLRAAFTRQIDAFDRGLALRDPPVVPARIPFENTTLPGYFFPADGRAAERRPLLILTNGYDSTVTELYFASGEAAVRWGYHVLVFDGPGQGEPLIVQGLHIRPDWETVVRAVVDYALTLPTVDPQRIALYGWSLGGYLAPRGASGEPRLAACIADPGLWSVAGALSARMPTSGIGAELVRAVGELHKESLQRLLTLLPAERKLNWVLTKRGFWVHGVDTLADLFAAMKTFTLDGRAEGIRCPTLLTRAEGDALGAGAGDFYDRLTCPKTLIEFTAAEGAGGHCEMLNRSLLNRRVLDWLDETLGS